MEAGVRRKLSGIVRKKRDADSPRGAVPPKRLKVKVKPPQVDGDEPGAASPVAQPASPTLVKRAPKSPATGFKRKLAGKAKKMMWDKNRRSPKSRTQSTDSDGPLSNYVEDCAASPCQKPHGSCINWIGCDDCEQWYHYICVGLPKNYQVTEDMVYICPRCQDTQGSRSARSSASSSLMELAAAAQEEDGASALLSLAASGAEPAEPTDFKHQPTDGSPPQDADQEPE